MCLVGLKANDLEPTTLKIEYDDEPYGVHLSILKREFDAADLIIGFNLKYDLHWLRKYGIYDPTKTYWDCQLAHFAITSQLNPYPSLNQVAEYCGLPAKLDVVKNDYWEKGIDTPDIPFEILDEYCKQDIFLTSQIYEWQQKYLSDKPKLRTLIRMMNMDMVVLEEMEWNGLILDVDEATRKAAECQARIREIDAQLNCIIGFDRVNWNSGPQLSAILYGGSISYINKEPITRILKSGKESIRIGNVEHNKSFPRLVEPIKGSELAEPGRWSVSEDVLSELHAKGVAKQIVELVLERHKVAKLEGTYYSGLQKLINEMEWENNIIHGNLNQCVAVTGRLSSTKPNMQNQPPEIDQLFRSRYC